MTKVVIKIPDNMKEFITGINETIYMEALKEVVHKKMTSNKKRLKEFKVKISTYEKRYGKSLIEFAKNVPDTLDGHEDWIEWSYLSKVKEELESNIQKFTLLIGE